MLSKIPHHQNWAHPSLGLQWALYSRPLQCMKGKVISWPYRMYVGEIVRVMHSDLDPWNVQVYISH